MKHPELNVVQASDDFKGILKQMMVAASFDPLLAVDAEMISKDY